jgi:hypothetical protein
LGNQFQLQPLELDQLGLLSFLCSFCNDLIISLSLLRHHNQGIFLGFENTCLDRVELVL